MSISQLDIAKELGVSQRAVSFALNGKPGVSKEIRRRVQEAAKRHGYRPSAAARAMVQQRTGQIGVLVPNSPGDRFTHPLAYETLLGINEGLQRAGLVAVLARLDDVQRDLAEQSRVFGEHLLDGMIVLDSMPADVEQRLERLITHTVWCDSNVWRDAGCLRRDERQAGRLAGRAAARGGYRTVCMMTYPPDRRTHFSTAQRYQGVREVLEAQGQSVIEWVEPPIGDDASRARIARTLEPDTVVICSSIYQAHAVRAMAEERGKLPGRDFGLVCCDDMHQLNRMWPGLSRATFDRYQLGLDAADMIKCVLDHGAAKCSSKLMPCDWIAGSTVRSGSSPADDPVEDPSSVDSH